jgi:hypothetical protein
MSPFYARLDNIEIPFSGIETSADKLGLALTGAAAAGAALHSLVTYRKKKDKNTIVEAPGKNHKEESS